MSVEHDLGKAGDNNYRNSHLFGPDTCVGTAARHNVAANDRSFSQCLLFANSVEELDVGMAFSDPQLFGLRC
jgi:hypothetical protein